MLSTETYSRVARSGHSLLRQQGSSTKPHRNAPQQRAVQRAQHCVQTARGWIFKWSRWNSGSSTAPSRANLRQVTSNLIIVHPAEMEQTVVHAFSLRASRVQAYGCYCLWLWGYRAEQSQFQLYDYYYVRVDVGTYLQSLAVNSCISACNSLCPWLCSGTGAL